MDIEIYSQNTFDTVWYETYNMCKDDAYGYSLS